MKLSASIMVGVVLSAGTTYGTTVYVDDDNTTPSLIEAKTQVFRSSFGN